PIKRQPGPRGFVGPEEGCPSDGARLGAVAKPEPEKQRQPAASAGRRVLPVDVQVGARLTDETGEWEIIGFTTNVGNDVHARVRRVDNAEVTMIRAWSAHE